MRFISNIPSLSVILVHAHVMRDPVTGHDTHQQPSKSLNFKSGYAETRDDATTDLALRHLARLKERGLRIHFGVYPADVKAAEARAKELGVELPVFSRNSGKTGPKAVAQPLPRELEESAGAAGVGTEEKLEAANATARRNAELEEENERLRKEVAAKNAAPKPDPLAAARAAKAAKAAAKKPALQPT